LAILNLVRAGSRLVAAYIWNAENRLASATKNGVTESYAYDADGNRIKKTSGGVTTRTFFPGVYEEENGVAIKHYSFNGMPMAIRKGGVLSYVHSDHLGSSSVETSASGASTASRTYYAYGSTRASSGTLQTDRTFTGQKQDGTGLLYYNARYYDSSLGTFLSPDTLVPDATRVIDYNRFVYARGNPLRYSDPSGHAPQHPRDPDPDNAACSTDWCWQNRWFMARGYGWDGSGWTKDLGFGGAIFYDAAILGEVLGDAGMRTSGKWAFEELTLVGQAVVDFARKIGGLSGAGVSAGLGRLKSLTGSVQLDRRSGGILNCITTPACTYGTRVEFYDALFASSDQFYIRGSTVHELAHVLNNTNCNPNSRIICGGVGFGIPDRGRRITKYGNTNGYEYWAEAVTDWVYGRSHYFT